MCSTRPATGVTGRRSGGGRQAPSSTRCSARTPRWRFVAPALPGAARARGRPPPAPARTRRDASRPARARSRARGAGSPSASRAAWAPAGSSMWWKKRTAARRRPAPSAPLTPTSLPGLGLAPQLPQGHRERDERALVTRMARQTVPSGLLSGRPVAREHRQRRHRRQLPGPRPSIGGTPCSARRMRRTEPTRMHARRRASHRQHDQPSRSGLSIRAILAGGPAR